MTASTKSTVTAVRSGTVLVDGRPETIVAGQTIWSRSCPELRDPKVAALFGLADVGRARSGLERELEMRRRIIEGAEPRPGLSRWVGDGCDERTTTPDWLLDDLQRSESSPGALASWRLPTPAEKAGIDTSSFDVQKTAEHEAAHATAAFLLDWEVTGATLRAEDGGGDCTVIHPRGLDGRTRDQQFAMICAAARAHVGWRRYDTDRGDRRMAFDALSRHVTDPRDATGLMEAASEKAKQLVATGRFRFIARRVEEALLEHGELDVIELGPLLRGARRDYARAA